VGILINITTSANYVVQTRGPSQTSISHSRQLHTGIEKEEMHNDDEDKFEGIECPESVTRRKVENNK
jgi:hypothetical protein